MGLCEKLLTAAGCWRRAVTCLKGVILGTLTMLQWNASHPRVYGLYKLDSMGNFLFLREQEVEAGKEVGVDLGGVWVDLE